MQSVKIGHTTHLNDGTGLSVFLFSEPARGGYVICGAGPATHELAPLDPDTSVSAVHGLMLAGGSAYGLYAGRGVMQYLMERNIGLSLPHGVVPIVPAACIYDLGYKNVKIPSDEDAYAACIAAKSINDASGAIGAGTGATVGKIVPQTERMSGGIGFAEKQCADGLVVMCYAVVNAIGDVRDEKQRIIAGAKYADGSFADCAAYLESGKPDNLARHASRHNTTLVSVFTNAALNKMELKRLSKMALAGMARAISPVFTCYDGDIIFSFSVGNHQNTNLLMIGNLAARLVQQSIIHAVANSEIVTLNQT